jgi:hypothetical protein
MEKGEREREERDWQRNDKIMKWQMNSARHKWLATIAKTHFASREAHPL